MNARIATKHIRIYQRSISIAFRLSSISESHLPGSCSRIGLFIPHPVGSFPSSSHMMRAVAYIAHPIISFARVSAFADICLTFRRVHSSAPSPSELFCVNGGRFAHSVFTHHPSIPDIVLCIYRNRNFVSVIINFPYSEFKKP